MKSYDESKTGYLEMDDKDVRILVQEPSDTNEAFHVEVVAQELHMIKGKLTEENVRSLAGQKDSDGIYCCAEIFKKIEEAANQHDDCTVFERAKSTI